MTLTLGLVLAGGALIAAFVSGLAGFAFALVASGVFFNVLAPLDAVPLVLAGSLAVQAMSLGALWRAVQWRRLAPFLVGGVVGVPIGVELLWALDPGVFRFLVGVFLVAYSGYMLMRSAPEPIARGGAAADGAIGLVGGVMGGLAGLSGAVPTIWCGLRGWSKDEQRGVYQPFIVVMQVLALAWIGGTIGVGQGTIGLFAICLPAMALGAWLGLRAYARVDDAQFRRIVLWLLMGSGLLLVL
jgi:hypothetical protein